MGQHPFPVGFREPVCLTTLPDGTIEVAGSTFRLKRPDTPECRALLDALTGCGGASSPVTPGEATYSSWTHLTVLQFQALGLLQFKVISGEQTVLAIRPISGFWSPEYRSIEEGQRVRASRFGTLRVENGNCLLESPLSGGQIIAFSPEVAKLWAFLAAARTQADCAAEAPCFDIETIRLVLEALLAARLVDIAGEDGRIAEDGDEGLQLWSHHELLFHSRSRFGRHDLPWGGDFRLSGRIAEPPPIKPSFPGEAVGLAVPGPALIAALRMTLLDALEQRRSVRQWDDDCPIGVEQLGHFLYLTCRISPARPERQNERQRYRTVRKPSPEAGAIGALEIYVLAHHCAGLARGAYHYAAAEHSLYPTRSANTPAVDSLLRLAMVAMASQATPQVLLLIAGRHKRVFWKYSSIGYALELKNVGVLFQTWYLMATAMGLGGCALGSGHADLLGELNGTPYEEESAIGEFALGSILTTT